MREVKTRLQVSSFRAKQVAHEVFELVAGHQADVIPLVVIVRHHYISIE
jgi:hypothetical protein